MTLARVQEMETKGMLPQYRQVVSWTYERASSIESCGVDVDRIVDSRSTPALLPFFGSACAIIPPSSSK